MQLSSICILLFVVSCYGADKYLTQQPDYVSVCQIKDPEFVKCSTSSVQKLFKQLKTGIPEAVKSIDPLFIKKASLGQSGTGAANLKSDLTQLKVTGFGEAIVKESKISDKDYSWETRFLVPLCRIEGQYDLDGRILVLQLKGKGDMFIEIEKLDVIMYTKTRLYEKGDFTFYNITNVKVNINPAKVKTNFKNLFNGNKELEDSTNQLFNESWQDFFEALRPTISETIEATFLSVLRRTFDYIPANFFISDIPKSTELYG